MIEYLPLLWDYHYNKPYQDAFLEISQSIKVQVEELSENQVEDNNNLLFRLPKRLITKMKLILKMSKLIHKLLNSLKNTLILITPSPLKILSLNFFNSTVIYGKTKTYNIFYKIFHIKLIKSLELMELTQNNWL